MLRPTPDSFLVYNYYLLISLSIDYVLSSCFKARLDGDSFSPKTCDSKINASMLAVCDNFHLLLASKRETPCKLVLRISDVSLKTKYDVSVG